MKALENDQNAILNHLRKYGYNGTIKHRNVVGSVQDDRKSLTLAAFKHIPAEYVDYLTKLYMKDFKLFGYAWSNNSEKYCSGINEKGHSCC